MLIDANIIINAYKGGKRADACKKILQRIRDGEQKAEIDPIVLDEFAYVFANTINVEFALRTYKNLLKIPNIRLLDINRKVCDYVPEFMERGLDPQDAFHVAVMKANGITTICSYDRDFDKIREIKRQEPI